MIDQKIGVSPHRVGGYERVTGTQVYVADIPLADVLHAKLVTIPCGRGRIIDIDASAAERVPGVRLVMTAADLPDPMPRFGPQLQDRPVIAVGETKFHGEAVAAVAADGHQAMGHQRVAEIDRQPPRRAVEPADDLAVELDLHHRHRLQDLEIDGLWPGDQTQKDGDDPDHRPLHARRRRR